MGILKVFAEVVPFTFPSFGFHLWSNLLGKLLVIHHAHDHVDRGLREDFHTILDWRKPLLIQDLIKNPY